MKKEIIVDLRAKKEIQQFPMPVQLEILNLISVLEQGGMLDEPDGKKLSGHSNLCILFREPDFIINCISKEDSKNTITNN